MPDLSDKDLPELWEMYQKAIRQNLPPLDSSPFPDELDQDLPRWIAFNIQLRLVENLPYDSMFPLEEAIKALDFTWGNEKRELPPRAKTFTKKVMTAFLAGLRGNA